MKDDILELMLRYEEAIYDITKQNTVKYYKLEDSDKMMYMCYTQILSSLNSIIEKHESK